MRTTFAHIRESLTSSYWFIPGLMLVGSAVAAWLTLGIDRAEQIQVFRLFGWAYSGGPEGAREVLSTLASSTITVAGVVFSITVATLTQASTQFGPRLLRNFMRDTGNQIVLGTFTATFVFCLLVLRTVETGPGAGPVPFLSVTCAIGLGIASICVLVYFIHHVSKSIQAPQVIATVGADLSRAVGRMYPEELGRGGPPPAGFADETEVRTRLLAQGGTVAAASSGYVQAIKQSELMALAGDHDLLLWVRVRPGDFVVVGRPLVVATPAASVTEVLEAQLRDAFILGRERTAEQDVEFAIHQMVEVAVRALSPGVNDPFTTVNCVDWLGDALSQLAARDVHSPFRYDQGRFRALARISSFEGFVDAACNQIRQHGATNVAVSLRMLEMVANVAPHVRLDSHRTALQRQAEMVHRAARAASPEPFDREALDGRLALANRALAGDPYVRSTAPRGPGETT